MKKIITTFLTAALLLTASAAMSVLADEPAGEKDEPVVITEIATDAPVTEPAVTTPKPVETTPKPVVTTPKLVTTTPKPVTTPVPTTPAVTEPPETEAPETEEVTVVPETEEPDEPDETEEPDETDDADETRPVSTNKRPNKTEGPAKTEEVTEETEIVTTDKEDEGVFAEKKMFATPLETVSFILGIFVIIFVFITLFTVARRIVKKNTAGK